MDVIDLDDETIDAEILNSMAVTNEHFKAALGSSNPSSLHESVSTEYLVIWRESLSEFCCFVSIASILNLH